MIQAGLALEGGAVRGVFTAGVLDYLMEQNIYFSRVVGVSSGSCNGVDYISRQIGRTRDCMIHKDKKEGYIGAGILLKKHCLFDMDKVFEEYPNHLYPFDFGAYENSEMTGEWVVTNALTGRAEYLDERGDQKKLMNICRASSSLPMLSPMVEIGGVPYLDGGIADPIPVRHLLSFGNEKNVMILTRNPGYRKKPLGRLSRRLYAHAFKDYPELMKALQGRYMVYNQVLERVEKLKEEGRVFLIRPLLPAVGRAEMHYDRLMEFYNHGYRQMAGQMDDLRAYLDA